MSGYVSPLPIGETYKGQRVHVTLNEFRQRVGCNPKTCRECYREKHWKAGQANG